jgi:hypothetical protein
MLERIGYLIQGRTIVSSELPLTDLYFCGEDWFPAECVCPSTSSRPVSGNDVELWQDGPPPLYTGRNCEVCSYNRLRSYPLDAVDRLSPLPYCMENYWLGFDAYGIWHKSGHDMEDFSRLVG